MIPVALAFGALVAAFVFHLALWRLHLPDRQLRALLVIFTGFYAVLASLVGFCPSAPELAGSPWISLAYASLFYWPAALCYVITYSAMEGDSPTLSLARHLHRKGDEGITREELEEFFRKRPFIGARIGALVNDGVLYKEEGGYRLADGQFRFFRLILGYRKIVFGPVKAGG